MPDATELSQKDKLFAAIVQAGGFRNWPSLKKSLDFFIDPHNGTHLLHALKADGLITLRESDRIPRGQESRVIDIRPTRKALAMTMNLQPEYTTLAPDVLQTILEREGVVSLEGKPSPRGRPMTIIGKGHKRHPVGKDMTDPAQHKAVAQGGPIERAKINREDQALLDRAHPIIQARKDRLEQNEKPISEIVMGPRGSEPVDRIPTRTFPTIRSVIDWSKYPLITQLGSRETKVAAAAKLMEEAGLADQAIAILETVTYTDLEKEVLSLVKELG